MTLEPGESAAIDLAGILPPDLLELIRRGLVEMTIEPAGRTMELLPGCFQSDYTILLDGKPYRRCRVCYTAGPPRPRYRRLLSRLASIFK